ncbi:proline--tRNA ligase [Cardinium endosymbiont of Sogatella furcifera]|uniref:proline--tRNA ligase n=1 Tax=Cardinium endosymbiont of Sogatella furcifera TaxID=650378 RepID=UPI000E0DBE7E|nr:proline--tRNA ligase [Cardinium endosymbiont of Sogatella furcifera]AXI24610.1 proline--tRNA ligase [Cardinium endosymbiont of Sogatella furcifera]
MTSVPTRASDFSAWYNALVVRAGLAENASVRGCMVIKPYGYAIWERLQTIFDRAFKETGHVNGYFPLLIPKSYLSKEASHVAGFAKECAVVTHYRLKMAEDGQGVVVDPAAKLEEELIVRPTSEAVIWSTYKNWIQSYRDLPILLNQWCNVVRWEMRTRLFLRTTEFLWQEGHTAHATQEEAEKEALQMLHLYECIIRDYMAIPLIKGIKTENERFAGAETTYTIEALMQDGKALQAGTAHYLGQRFAKAFEVTFTNQAGIRDYVWGTSWGITTRLMGALIMIHSDDNGLVLPPKIAPIQVVMVPIYKTEHERAAVVAQLAALQKQLNSQGVRVKLDERDTRKPGYKFAEYEEKGVPIRVALGPNDLQNHTVELARRDTKEKCTIPIGNLTQQVTDWLEMIQRHIYERALSLQQKRTLLVDDYTTFKKLMATQGGFLLAHWDGTTETEAKIKAETKATIRCIPLDEDTTAGYCIYSGKPSQRRVVFAQAY